MYNERVKYYLGFSIFEILIVVALLIVVAVVAVPSYRGFADSNDLVVAMEVVGQSLSQAQSLAISGEEGSYWGVHIENRRVTIFKGSEFAGRDSSADKSLMSPAGVDISGLLEVVFTKFNGLPQQTGQIVFSGRVGGFKILTINEQGAISY